MGFSRCLACNSEWNTCKAFVRTCTDFYTLNIATLNLVEGKLYSKNETVKKIQTGIDGIASTSADLLPYGNYR